VSTSGPQIQNAATREGTRRHTQETKAVRAKIYLQGFEAELSELTKVGVKPVAIKPCDNRCCITLFARLKDPNF
jgi:hypothetical protein